jgi:hypothetical protein
VTTLTQRLERAVADKGLSIGDAWNLLSEALEYIERLEADVQAKQARIDALMLEHCPDEMTAEQREEWARHQEPVRSALSAQRGGE